MTDPTHGNSPKVPLFATIQLEVVGADATFADLRRFIDMAVSLGVEDDSPVVGYFPDDDYRTCTGIEVLVVPPVQQ